MISIDGLTKRQIEILDTIWSFDTFDEVCAWQSTLPLHEQLLCEALMELIMLAFIDEATQNQEIFPETQSLLREIFQNNSENQ